jgi:hypothetical protein
LYGFRHIAGASRIIQWGFDEIESPVEEGGSGGKGGDVTIVTLECAGIVPSGTADEIVAHIEKAWVRGQQAVEVLRAELAMEDIDVFCPLVEGGVNLHKLYGVMHDTCYCANLASGGSYRATTGTKKTRIPFGRGVGVDLA